jgi:hypothetical protein
MSAPAIEAGRIAGALKCMNVLRQMKQSAESFISSGHDETVEDYFAQRLSDTRALVAALGPMTPEQEGAIAALAEFIHSAEIDGGVPDVSPGAWLPLAAMTDSEQEELIGRMEAENAEIDAQYNVISLDERRAAR